MHLAIYAENPADRKQLERLLQREADKTNAEQEIFYTDSFGSIKNMLLNPRQYDGFFLDFEESGSLPENLFRKLYRYGVRVPVVLCTENTGIKITSVRDIPVYILKKPVEQKELSRMLEKLHSIMKSAKPMIELRTEDDTYYVTEPEILYALARDNKLELHLTNERTLEIQNTVPNLFSEISRYESFFAPNQKTIINGRHIRRIMGWKITMVDGCTFSVKPSYLTYARYTFHKYHSTDKKSDS